MPSDQKSTRARVPTALANDNFASLGSNSDPLYINNNQYLSNPENPENSENPENRHQCTDLLEIVDDDANEEVQHQIRPDQHEQYEEPHAR